MTRCANRDFISRICYVLSFLSVVISDDVFYFSTIKDGGFFLFIKYLIYGFLFIYFIFLSSDNKIEYKLAIFLFFVFSSFIATQLLNADFSFGYYYQFLIFVLAAFIVRECDFENFAISSKNIIYFIGVVSLVIYFLNFVFPEFFDWAPVVLNVSDVPVKNIYVGYVYLDETINRNSSIFREPGVFAFYVFFALLVEIFIEKELSWPRVVVLMCIMMTTYSTSGIICSFLLVFFSFKEFFAKAKFGFFVYSVVALGLIFSLFTQELTTAVFHKFQSDSNAYGSTISRTASLIVPFYISLSNPFFGVGLNNYSELFTIFSYEFFGLYLNSDGQSTNTYMSIVANYGWPLGILFFYLTYKIAQRLTGHKSGALYVSILIILILSSQDMRYSLFVLSLLIFGLCRRNKVLLHK